MTVAYVYKWTHLPTMMWYIGSRAKKNCQPEDGYLCSSKTVKTMIMENRQDWLRSIVATGSKEEMRELETHILQVFDARNDSRSLNCHNNDYLNYIANQGEKNPMYGKTHTVESRQKMSIASKGKKRSLEARKNISIAHIGVSNGPHSEQTKQKMSDSKKGRPSPKKGIKIFSDKKYYHNGLITRKFIPGTEADGYVPGRIIGKKELVATELNVQTNQGES